MVGDSSEKLSHVLIRLNLLQHWDSFFLRIELAGCFIRLLFIWLLRSLGIDRVSVLLCVSLEISSGNPPYVGPSSTFGSIVKIFSTRNQTQKWDESWSFFFRVSQGTINLRIQGYVPHQVILSLFTLFFFYYFLPSYL